VWHPEVSPRGPVVVLVSLPDQTLYVYRNGVRIRRSTVSTGKPGKRTPTGVFTVLQKKVSHESSIYKGAQMPHMQRLTWSGVAMHAGYLPGYPASAGCVRLPVDFAATTASRGRAPNVEDLANRLGIPAAFEADIRGAITPGTTLVLTNLAVNAGTQSAPGFDILTD
jgi:L,D-transpeptidase catalytic domain